MSLAFSIDMITECYVYNYHIKSPDYALPASTIMLPVITLEMFCYPVKYLDTSICPPYWRYCRAAVTDYGSYTYYFQPVHSNGCLSGGLLPGAFGGFCVP